MRTTVVMSGLVASLSLQWGTASLIELLWTLSGLVGVYLTWGNLRDAKLYITALRHHSRKNGIKLRRETKIIAFGHYRNEIMRMWMFGIITMVGAVAMATPPAVKHAKVTPVSLAITLGLLAITGILVTSSFLDRRQRDLVLALDDEG